MIIENILPLIPILSIGYTFTVILVKISDIQKKLRITIKLIMTLVFGSATLIIPLVVISVWSIGLFYEYMISYITFGYLCGLIWIYKGIRSLVNQLEDFNFIPGSYQMIDKILVIIIGVGCAAYFVTQIILPERGYDSLMIYLPEGFLFYQLDKIPPFDYLTFFPVFKAPLTTILYSFGFYTTKSSFIRLIPLLFFYGLFLVAYEFGIEIYDDKTKALMITVFVMIMPLTWFMLMMFSYYQDIYLSFFFSSTILFYLKSLHRKHGCNTHSLLAGLSLALTLSTKVNGWTLFLLIPLITPAKGKLKKVILGYLGILSLFLSYQIGTKVFIGLVPVILVISIAVGYLIYTNNSSGNSKYLIPTLSIGFILGFHWLYGVATKLPSSFDGKVMNLYVRAGKTIKWVFDTHSRYSYGTIFETVHGIDPIAVILFFFVGIAMCLGWLLPKLIGLLNSKKIHLSVIWLLSYWAIWLAYHGTSSFRYLTPIIIPMCVLVVHGIYNIIDWMEQHSYLESPEMFRNKLTLYFMAITPFSYTYLIPIDPNKAVDPITGLQYDLYIYMASIYTLMSPVFFVIGILIGALPIGWKILQRRNIGILNWNISSIPVLLSNRIKHRRIIQFLTLIIVLVPVTVASGITFCIMTDNNDVLAFFAENSDPSYREVIDTIIEDGEPQRAIMVVNMPGLHYFTSQPSLDLYIKHDYVKSFLESQNITKNLDLLRYPDNYIDELKQFGEDTPEVISTQLEKMYFGYFVILAKGHQWFRHYYQSYLWNYKFFHILKNDHYFDRLLLNNQYIVYKAKYENPTFSGPLSLYFSDGIRSSSLIESTDCTQKFNQDLSLFLDIDQSQVTKDSYNISLNVDYFDVNHEKHNYTYKQQLDPTGLSTNKIMALSNIDINDSCFQLGNITLNIDYLNKDAELINKEYQFYVSKPIEVKKNSSLWSLEYMNAYKIEIK